MPCQGLGPPLYGVDEVVVGGGSGDLCCQDKVLSRPCGPFASADETAPDSRWTGRCGRRRWDNRQGLGTRGCLRGRGGDGEEGEGAS